METELEGATLGGWEDQAKALKITQTSASIPPSSSPQPSTEPGVWGDAETRQ